MILFGIDIILIGVTYWTFKNLVFENNNNILVNDIVVDDNNINNNISNIPPSYQQSLNDSVISELPPSYE